MARASRRLHIVLFSLLCLISSAVGFVLFLIFGVFCVELLSVVTKHSYSNMDGPVGFSFALAGLVIPSLILIKRRTSRDQPYRFSRLRDAELTIPLDGVANNAAYYIEDEQTQIGPDGRGKSPDEWKSEFTQTYAVRLRIIDWGFLLYNLMYIPVLLILLVGDAFRKVSVSDQNHLMLFIAAPAVFTAFLELKGTAIKNDKLTYPVRIQIYGPFAFPIFRRTIDLNRASEATADTKYQNVRFSELTKLRFVYISGAFIQAKVWFSSKGRRDWLFSQIRVAAPHVRQYRGRW